MHRATDRSMGSTGNKKGWGGDLLTCSLQLRRSLFSHSYETFQSHSLQEGKIKELHLFCSMRPVAMEAIPQIAQSLNSLGPQLPPSITPFLFSLCFGLCVHLRVAMTELMVWGREEWAGATDAVLLTQSNIRKRYADRHICTYTHLYSTKTPYWTRAEGPRGPPTGSVQANMP